MKTEDQIHQLKAQAQDDAFRAEFRKALSELLGKIRFRGQKSHEWIAEQIAGGLSEEPMVRQHLMELLPTYDEPEKDTA